jgi:hypothetical protein
MVHDRGILPVRHGEGHMLQGVGMIDQEIYWRLFIREAVYARATGGQEPLPESKEASHEFFR